MFAGCGHGTKMNKAFMLQKPMDLKKGVNHIAVLASTLGMMVGIHRSSIHAFIHQKTCMMNMIQ